MAAADSASSRALVPRSATAALRTARTVPILRQAVRLVRGVGLTEALEALAAPVDERHAGIDPTSARQLARSVVRASRVVRGADCLPQAVAIVSLLTRTGGAPILVLGCRRTGDGGWHAHAWVEVAGEVLPAASSDGFTPLARCLGATGWQPAPVRAEDGRQERPSSWS